MIAVQTIAVPWIAVPWIAVPWIAVKRIALTANPCGQPQILATGAAQCRQVEVPCWRFNGQAWPDEIPDGLLPVEERKAESSLCSVGTH